ncbi:MAG TPA: site-specific integrase [Terriglobia bacterium]|nr:site-specific integrase [Terriglobia bacterium]
MTARYQYGNLTTRKRKKGPDVWQFRWMENGKPKSVLIGTVKKYPTRADAERAVEHLRITINAENPQQNFHSVTVGALIDRFMEEYAPKRCRENTRNNYRGLFNNHIRAKWEAEFVQNVKTTAVEDWLESYPHSRQIKSHVRNLMHTLFQAAIRWEMVERNPIDLVRQSSKRLKKPGVLTPAEFKVLLQMLAEPYRTMVITVACLGLRVSELVALKWGDLDFQNLAVQVGRAFVRGEVNPTKTDASEGVLPLDPDLAEVLLAHRQRAVYVSDADYVFANESGNPRWPESMLTDHIKPAAAKAGVGNVGWHTFRHTYSTLLHALGTKPAVQKEVLRHANIQTTLNVYTRAISEEKRKAASEVAHTLYEFVPTGKAKSA